MKIFRNKWILFLIFIIVFVVLDVEVRNVTLAERGIVLGIGIDRESDEYIVTAEILSPSNLGAENYRKNRLLVVERGDTLSEAFEKMDKSLGVRVSLRHTVLIVMGDSMLKVGDYAPLIDLFVRNDVSDNTYIVGTENSAKELFSAKPPLYSTISYKIQETFMSPDIESGMVSVTVKDFFEMYLSASGGIYLPIMEVGKGDIAESGDKVGTDSVNMGKIAILDRDGEKSVLTHEESEGMSYIFSRVNEANVYVPSESGGFDVDIIDTLTTKKFDVANRRLTLDVKMWVQFTHPKDEMIMDNKDTQKSEKKRLAGEIIAKTIQKAYKTAHKEGVDILGIATGFYRRMGSRYEEYLGEGYLDSDMVDVDVTLILK